MRALVVGIVCVLGVFASGVVDAVEADSVVPIDTDGASPSLVLDASGFPVIAYRGETSADLLLVHCNDVDCAGGDDVPVIVDAEGDTGKDPSLVLDASGFPVIAYRGETSADLLLVHCNDVDCAGGDDVPVIVDAEGDTGQDPSLVLDASGFPVVAYHDVSNAALRLVHCNDASCAGGDDVPVTHESSIGPAGPTGFNPSMTLDAMGNPVVVYNDRVERQGQNLGDLRFMHCNDPVCGGDDDASVILDTVFWKLAAPASLVLDASGNPVISYIKRFGSAVVLLHCNDPDCSGGDDESVVIRSYVEIGEATSVALDASGNPVVAYNWYEHQDFSRVGVARCADRNCLTSTVQHPDSPANRADETGYEPSLVLDALGYPVIAHHSGPSKGGVRLLHCNDPDCSEEVAVPTTTVATPSGELPETGSNVMSVLLAVVFLAGGYGLVRIGRRRIAH